MSYERIFESPDGGKTVYERKPNEDIKDRRLVTESNDDWKVIRKDLSLIHI